MKMPAFFDEVPRLRVRDPLADALGCADGGVLEYGYADVVRLCGHSSPTVAGAYWITWRALHELYAGELPLRGGVKVDFRDDARVGSTGMVATVVQMLTGAAGSSGFRGIVGRFARAGLIRHAPALPLSMRFTRLDNGAAIDAAVDLSFAAIDPALELLLQRRTSSADCPALTQLGQLWHEQVRHLLLDLAQDPGVFVVRPANRKRAVPVPRFLDLLREHQA
jgi:hypothetical protein